MVNTCAVFGCGNRQLNSADVFFHCLPKEENLRKLWLESIPRNGKRRDYISSHMCVCSEHFLPSDYLYGGIVNSKKLKRNAVPSVFKSALKQKRPRKGSLAQRILHLETTPIPGCETTSSPEFLPTRINGSTAASTSTPAVGHPVVHVKTENIRNKSQSFMIGDRPGTSGKKDLVRSQYEIPEVHVETLLRVDDDAEELQIADVSAAGRSNVGHFSVFAPVAQVDTVSRREQDEADHASTVNQLCDLLAELSAKLDQAAKSIATLEASVATKDEELDSAKAKEAAAEETIKKLTARCRDLKSQADTAERRKVVCEAMLDTVNCELANTKTVLAQMQLKTLPKAHHLFAVGFSMSEIKEDAAALTYYTGFESVAMFNGFEDFVNPSRPIFYSSNLTEEDQLLLVLCKLRHNYDTADLAFRFQVSERLVENVFVKWINHLYYRLGCLDIWPDRQALLREAPEVFKQKYPKTVVVVGLDGTEMKMGRASAASCDTVKGLLGCHTNGSIIFISKLYGKGNADVDRQIVLTSGFLECLKLKLQNGQLQPGDAVMIDQHLNIRAEVEALGLNVDVPIPKSKHLTEEEFWDTEKIVSARVHVERAIRRVKQNKMLTGVIPKDTLPHLNQMWTVCCLLTLFQSATKPGEWRVST